MNTDPYKPPESGVFNSNVVSSPAFARIFDFGYTRTAKQAVAFYFVYLVMVLILGAVLGGVVGSLGDEPVQRVSFFVGMISAIIICTALSIVISVKKSIFSSYKTMVLIFVTLVLSAILGAIGGLIPVAYISTLNSNT